MPTLLVVGPSWRAARTGGSATGRFAAFVVTFALSLSLLLAAELAELSDLSNVAYSLSLVIGLIGTFGAGIALGELFFKHDLRASVIQGLSCGVPDLSYCGPPVLGAVVGPAGTLAGLVGNLVTFHTILFIALVLLHESGKQEGAGPVPSHLRVIGASLLGAVTRSLVGLPVLGTACVLLGVRLPAILTSMTNERGPLTPGGVPALRPFLRHARSGAAARQQGLRAKAPLTAMASNLLSILSISAVVAKAAR